MALQDLPTQEMVTVTGQWLDPERQRPLIERCPRASPLLEDIASAHANILVFQTKAKREADEIPKLRARTSALDAHHDRLARGINYILLGLVELQNDLGKAEEFIKLRSELFPHGLEIVQRSYLAQAGDADMREERLSDSSKKLLEDACVKGGDHNQSLRACVNEWGKVARELGEVEAEKVRLAAAEPSDISSSAARRAWINIVSLFLQTLELEKALTDAERRIILEPLRNAEAKAARKRALAKKRNQPYSPDAPEEEEEGDEA